MQIILYNNFLWFEIPWTYMYKKLVKELVL